MTSICPSGICFTKMNGVMKALVITVMAIMIGVLGYVILPLILPGNFFILFVMFPMALLGLLFGLGLFGLAFGLNKVWEQLNRK